MTSPTYHCVPKGSLSRRELASRFPGTYSLTIEHGNWLCRYVSNAPENAEGEAWLARAKAIENHSNSWCVLSQTDEPEELLFIWVCDGAVMESNRCTTMQLDSITLQRAGIVWLTDSQLSSFLPSGCKTDVVEPLSTEERMSWQLKKPMPKWPLALIFGALVLSGTGWFVLQKQQSTVEPVTTVVTPTAKVIDPWQVYRNSLVNSADAYHVIQNAVALGLYGSVMPPGWSLSSVTFDGVALALLSVRDTFGQRLVMDKWLRQYPEFSQSELEIFHKEEELTASTNRHKYLGRWQGTVTSVDGLAQAIRDVLTPMKWKFTSTHEENVPQTYMRKLTLEKSRVSLKELQEVGLLVSEMPVGIAFLKLTPTNMVTYYDAVMTLTLHGSHE